ncbi:MAG: hypothetical protein LBV67_00850 [Streptococcaceae bacterium]|jgi:hypothetical protein|nr:hypothetical protein [Streptococcaceae bacterium]
MKGLSKKVIAIITGVFVVFGVGISFLTHTLTHNNDLKNLHTGGITLLTLQDEISLLENQKGEVHSQVETLNSELKKIEIEVENSKKKLPTYKAVKGGDVHTGTYTVGQDLQEGVYDFNYKTTKSEGDYSSNDYLWVTRAGSKGTQETWGGKKFDERFGSFDYSVASKGGTGHITLHKGDVVTVDESHGNWTY